MKKLLATLLLALSPLLATAQWQPNKIITNLYGIGPGSGNERAWRIIYEQLEREKRAEFINQYMPGADTVVATNHFKSSPADGHHVQIITIEATWLINELFNKPLVKYTLDDFVFGPSIGTSSMVLLSNPNIPVTNMTEFVQYFKKNHDKISIGIGTSGKIPGEELFAKIGVKNHGAQLITYKSGAQAALDVAGGHISFALLSAPIAYPLYREGKVKYIAQFGNQKIDALKDVSLAKDVLPGLVHENIWGLMFPKNTPPAVIQWYEQEVQRITTMPETRAKQQDQLITTDRSLLTGAAFTREVERQRREYLK